MYRIHPFSLSIYCLFWFAGFVYSLSSNNETTYVVDLLSVPQSPQIVLAVQVCSGLMNRNNTAAAFILLDSTDSSWLSLVDPSLPQPPPLTSITNFMSICFSTVAGERIIRYNYTAQRALLPQLITVAGILDAVPLEDGSPYLPPPSKVTVIFDAINEWINYSPLNATSYIYYNYVNMTTTLSKMDPGYDLSQFPLDPSPPLTQSIDFSLTDYIVKNKLFNMFLVWGCLPGSDENILMEIISQSNPWPRPIAVFGYDDTFPLFGGDIFEAETTCVSHHNMGQVATTGVTNLAYFSRKGPITTPLQQNPVPWIPFNSSKTYMTFIVGDGDNIAYIKGTRFEWFQQRITSCNNTVNKKCAYPLGWSISPHLLQVAPDMLRWYYTAAASTSADYFVLPPSGHLYAYPGLMDSGTDQANFVTATETDAWLLNASTTVEWEMLGTWENAIQTYVPRYTKNGIIKGLFAVNVPYMVPIIEFGENEYYKNCNGTFLFKPNEWRGTTGGAILPPFMLNATAFADLINSYPSGTISHIYMTSDGGAQLSDFDALASLLSEHVEIVAPSTAIDLIQQREGQIGLTQPQ